MKNVLLVGGPLDGQEVEIENDIIKEYRSIGPKLPSPSPFEVLRSDLSDPVQHVEYLYNEDENNPGRFLYKGEI